MLKSLLVANRGEIARRIIRTAKALGVWTTAVYSEPDASALFVKEADQAFPLEGRSPQETYLHIDKILKVAQEVNAEGVHPGYGFLSEKGEFARRVQEAGLIFVGPSPEAIALLGDKAEARRLARKNGVPLAPGVDELSSFEEAKKGAKEIGYPVILKAVAGGGGIGMKRVDKEEDLEKSWNEVRNRAKAAFSDDRIFLEKYLPSPHHIEIQVLGNRGETITFWERECSVQRRHQKVIEESPSPFVSEELRKELRSAAQRLLSPLGYENAGTVEFVVDAERHFYFLEVNTRLQVEHPVTEEIAGVDLVAEQLRIASGEGVSEACKRASFQGHAVEARVYAEDPVRFFPSPGKITRCEEPRGERVRVDSGFCRGDTITPFYDPMIAKLITWGRDRTEALQRMEEALENYLIEGIKTNIPFLQRAVKSEIFQKGIYDTHFIQALGPS